MYRILIPKTDLIAKISFSIFIFVTFFGTALPFQNTMQEIGADEIGTSNVVNQILFITLFLMTTIAAIPVFNKIFSFIIKEKALIIFLIWALLTIAWSTNPLVSLKRWFQIFTIYWIIIVYFNYRPEIKNLIILIKPVIYVYILITIISVLFISGAKDPAFNAWRGLAATKNNLGQIGVILSVITFIIYRSEFNKINRFLSLLFFFLSIIITLGTFSSTSYIALFIFLLGSVIFYMINKIFYEIGTGKFVFFTLVITALTLFIIIFYFDPRVTDILQSLFGKEGSFSDRGRLWTILLLEIYNHPFLGCGFQGFWVVDSPKIQLLYNSFIWLPIQAHNGYLDMINEVGVIGLIFFFNIIYRYIKVAIKYKFLNLWAWFIILPLISSIMESLLFRASDLNTRYLFISYTLLMIHSNKSTKLK